MSFAVADRCTEADGTKVAVSADSSIVAVVGGGGGGGPTTLSLPPQEPITQPLASAKIMRYGRFTSWGVIARLNGNANHCPAVNPQYLRLSLVEAKNCCMRATRKSNPYIYRVAREC